MQGPEGCCALVGPQWLAVFSPSPPFRIVHISSPQAQWMVECSERYLSGQESSMMDPTALLLNFVRIDTSNPPGDCRGAAELLYEAARVRALVADLDVSVEILFAEKPNGSPMGPLYGAMETAVLAVHHDAVVLPHMCTGFTDSCFFRSIGIPTYGLIPLLLPREEYGKIHGVEERIPVAGIEEMTRIVYKLSRGGTGADPVPSGKEILYVRLPCLYLYRLKPEGPFAETGHLRRGRRLLWPPAEPVPDVRPECHPPSGPVAEHVPKVAQETGRGLRPEKGPVCVIQLHKAAGFCGCPVVPPLHIRPVS